MKKKFSPNFVWGFSLMELMIVMTILTILLAMATPIITKRAKSTANSVANSGSETYFATCNDSSATADKTATSTKNIALKEGLTVLIKFNNSNTADAPTLNVNNTGAKVIYSEGGNPVSANSPAYFPAGARVEFIYDGTNWIYKRRVVESFVKSNSAEWYRIYSDGWIEQGGFTTISNVTFPIPFSHSVKNVTPQKGRLDSVHVQNTAEMAFQHVTLTGFSTGAWQQTAGGNITAQGIVWTACGY